MFACRATWQQTRLASPARQRQSPLIPQYDRLPGPETTNKLASAQQTASITPADSCIPNSHYTGSHPASLSLPLLQQQRQQQQSTHQGLSRSVCVRQQRTPRALLQTQKVCMPQHLRPQHLRRSRKRARPKSSSSASGTNVLARQHIFRTASAPDAIMQSAHQQAEALRSSAQAVLGSLNWADLQLSCSTVHAAAAASASAGVHSSGGDEQMKAGGGGAADWGTGCCAPAHRPLHTQPASCRQRHISGLTTSPSQVQLEQDGGWGSKPPAAVGALCGQSEEQCAAINGGWWAVRPGAEQEVAGGGRESSGMADSEATWSEGGDLHGNTPCLLSRCHESCCLHTTHTLAEI